MADAIISQLPTAAALQLDDLVPIVQAGVTSKASIQQFATQISDYAVTPALELALGTPNTFAILAINGGQLAGFRNRIINGDMRIDQRNNGLAASTTDSLASLNKYYFLDRWCCNLPTDSGYPSVQRYPDGSLPAPDHSHSLKVTCGFHGSSPLPNYKINVLRQTVEGFNIQDFNFGLPDAQPLTLTFWAKSTVVGRYGVFFMNGAKTRSYVTGYTISNINVWERQTFTIPGDALGTWYIDERPGLTVGFNFDSGSDYTTVVENAWFNGEKYAPTNCVRFGLPGITSMQITGVQLELGTIATPFEQRSIATELTLCQRYAERLYIHFMGNSYISGGVVANRINYNTPKRVAPEISAITNSSTGASIAQFDYSKISGFTAWVSASAAGNRIENNSDLRIFSDYS